jgi:hypothetical protein
MRRVIDYDMIFHQPGDPAPCSGTTKPAYEIDGYRYNSDLPEITLETPTIDFSDVPHDITFDAVLLVVRVGSAPRNPLLKNTVKVSLPC